VKEISRLACTSPKSFLLEPAAAERRQVGEEKILERSSGIASSRIWFTHEQARGGPITRKMRARGLGAGEMDPRRYEQGLRSIGKMDGEVPA
jgi:hypothetical protein